MRSFTVFCDESGLFQAHAVGLRVVVAVVFPLAFDDAERACAEALDAGRGQWPAPFHANECTSPDRVRDQARRNAVRALATERHGDARRASLQKLGASTLRGVRVAVGVMLARAGAWVRLCGEHDVAPELDPWPRMMACTLEEVLLEVARRAAGPHEVHLRVASRGLSEPSAFALPAGCVLASRRLPLASEVAGLQVADVLAHALGPRGGQAAPVPHPRDHHLAGARQRLSIHFGAPECSLGAGGALETHGEVMRAADPTVRAVVERLRRMLHPLPPRTLRYAVEGSIETVEARP